MEKAVCKIDKRFENKWVKASKILVGEAIEKAGTVELLAKKIGVVPGTIKGWINPAIPSPENIRKLQEFLKHG